ncbi:hypothetical protein D3C85_1029010 [compost metagenome]
MSLRFQHPVFLQLECVAGLRGYRPSLRVVVDARQLASLHSVVEPAVLEPGVHVGAEFGLVVLKPCAVHACAESVDAALCLVWVAVGAGCAVSRPVSEHGSQMQAIGLRKEFPLRKIPAALQQEKVGAYVKVAVAAVAAFPFSYRAQPECFALAVVIRELLRFDELRFSQAVVHALHEHLPDKALVGQVSRNFRPVQRLGVGCGPGRGRRSGRSGRRLRFLFRPQVPALIGRSRGGPLVEPIFVGASHSAAGQRERTRPGYASVDHFDHLNPACRRQCTGAARVLDA